MPDEPPRGTIEPRDARQYIASLPDFTGEFSGTFDAPAYEFLFGPPARPWVEMTITMAASDGHQYAQADADLLVGRRVIYNLTVNDDDTRQYVGVITDATVHEDGGATLKTLMSPS